MGDNRSTLDAMRSVRKRLESCVDTTKELNDKLDEYIKRQNDYFHQEYIFLDEKLNMKISELSEDNISSGEINNKVELNVENIIIALKDIQEKYRSDTSFIARMIDLLESDDIMNKSVYLYQTILRSVESFLDKANYNILPNELMVIYYGMYLLRIKGNEMLRKTGN